MLEPRTCTLLDSICRSIGCAGFLDDPRMGGMSATLRVLFVPPRQGKVCVTLEMQADVVDVALHAELEAPQDDAEIARLLLGDDEPPSLRFSAPVGSLRRNKRWYAYGQLRTDQHQDLVRSIDQSLPIVLDRDSGSAESRVDPGGCVVFYAYVSSLGTSTFRAWSPAKNSPHQRIALAALGLAQSLFNDERSQQSLESVKAALKARDANDSNLLSPKKVQ